MRFEFADQSKRCMRHGLRADVRAGHGDHNCPAHGTSPNAQGMRVHSENADVHLLFGADRISHGS